MSETQLRITPLGGLGEIGMNCQLWETEKGAVLVDCGLMFPDDFLWGVDVVIPPFDCLPDREKILGVVLTHGHEDHIGALPWLVPNFRNLDIYGSSFTLALVEHKLTEHGLLDRVNLHPVEPFSALELGDLRFHFIPVAHSIPQGYALGVDSPIGKIIHSGDFKIDSAEEEEDCSLCDRLAAFAGGERIRLLLSDSTNIEIEGHSRPEKEVRDTLEEIFAKTRGRIVITLFSSHIQRIRNVMELAAKFGRAILVSGRSLSTNIEKASKLGLLDTQENLHMDYAGLPNLPAENTVVLVTGTQGEPMSAMTRIAKGEHKQISLHPGDTVIMSARVIPGNARAVSRLINKMYRLGVKVYHDSKRTIHATGHACREELTMVLNRVRPEYFIPIHGEYRHLAQHARLAVECGVESAKALVLEDGQPVSLSKTGCICGQSSNMESVLVDGKGVGDVGRLVLRERKLLGGEGLVIVVLIMAQGTREVLHGPEMISRGFVFQQRYDHILEDAKCLVLDLVETLDINEYDNLPEKIRITLRRFFKDVLGRDPIVVPIVNDV